MKWVGTCIVTAGERGICNFVPGCHLWLTLNVPIYSISALQILRIQVTRITLAKILTGYILCGRYQSKYFTYVSPLTHHYTNELGTIIIFILQQNEAKLASKWWNLDFTQAVWLLSFTSTRQRCLSNWKVNRIPVLPLRWSYCSRGNRCGHPCICSFLPQCLLSTCSILRTISLEAYTLCPCGTHRHTTYYTTWHMQDEDMYGVLREPQLGAINKVLGGVWRASYRMCLFELHF